eukprot:SAG11_NODE_3852_length_2190_cov_2.636059_1_plen_116_part_00
MKRADWPTDSAAPQWLGGDHILLGHGDLRPARFQTHDRTHPNAATAAAAPRAETYIDYASMQLYADELRAKPAVDAAQQLQRLPMGSNGGDQDSFAQLECSSVLKKRRAKIKKHW